MPNNFVDGMQKTALHVIQIHLLFALANSSWYIHVKDHDVLMYLHSDTCTMQQCALCRPTFFCDKTPKSVHEY